MHSTLIRLPGYPLFLAACFRIFGMENYVAAACVQIALELAGCLLLADFARRIAPQQRLQPRRCARHAVAGGAVPVHGDLRGQPLTESPTLFVPGAGALVDGALP